MESTVMNSTEDLNRLSQEVLEYYEITPETTTVIQGGSIKTVWKVLTPKGTVCLKRLKQPCEKALFS
ncbi:MAG: CotS family spore coat protein, partial [Clostridia bacterium]|nr:CotS family spore coat protein [Clostridia bacterium]